MTTAMADDPNWWGLAALTVLIAGFVLAILLLVVLPQRRNAGALAALGKRRGWAIDHGTGLVQRGLGSTWRTNLRPQDGSAWSCTVTVAGSANRQIRMTEFLDPTLRPSTGMVVIGPDLDDGAAQLAAQLFGNMAGDPGKLALGALMGDDASASEAAHLRPIDRLSSKGVFASDRTLAADVHRMVFPVIQNWRRNHASERDFPILVLGPQGCRVRLRTDASRADKLEAFVDHALSVTAALRSGPA